MNRPAQGDRLQQIADLHRSEHSLHPQLPWRHDAVLALVSRVCTLGPRTSLTWMLLLAMLCLGFVGGAAVGQVPATGCPAPDFSTTATSPRPALSSALEHAASVDFAPVEATDAQDDPAASPALGPIGSHQHKRFQTVPAIAFSSVEWPRSERPPIRSFFQS
jgi:hypothetical protein